MSDSTTPKPAKREVFLKLLRRKSGASLAQLRAATGWQPHSVRAAISGLRKAGYAIEREAETKAGDGPVYRVARDAAAAGDAR